MDYLILNNLAEFVIVVIAIYGTPGPAVAAIIANSLRNGFRSTLPLVCGIQVGLNIIFICLALGLNSVITTFPWLYDFIRWAGIAYLCYLAWDMFCANQEGKFARKLSFSTGVLIMFLNPKVYAGTIIVLTQFVPLNENYIFNALVTLLLTALLVVSLDLAWSYAASSVRHLVNTPQRRLLINRILAITIFITAISMVFNN